MDYDKLIAYFEGKFAEYEQAYLSARDMANANHGAMEATKYAIAQIKQARAAAAEKTAESE